jgi:hypothetical protein
MQNGYHQAYAAWKRDPEAFWREAAAEIDWFKPPERVFSPDDVFTAAGSRERKPIPVTIAWTGMSRPDAAARRPSSSTAP